MLIDDRNLWSIEAEASVLGSMIIDRDCIGRVLPLLNGDMFFGPEHKILFDVLLGLYTDNKPTDAVALRNELKIKGKLDEVGGVEYIGRVLESIVSSTDVEYYAGIIKDRYQYRNLIAAVEQIQGVISEPLDVNEQIEKIHSIALGLEQDNPEQRYYVLSDVIDSVVESMQKGRQDVIPTGFPNIDHFINGVSPGELCIIAARPSVGKSALALDFTLGMARAGKSVLFFTLEMPYHKLVERAISNVSRVSLQRLKGDTAEFEREKITQTVNELKSLGVVFDEKSHTPEQQIAFIRARAKLHGVDVVIVDYLQLMHTGGRSENRTQEMSTISRKLKLAAVSEKVPIIALSQLNRQVEARQNHRPRLSDLRDTGAIEQDADIVMLLHREDYYRRDENPEIKDTDFDGKTEVIIAKNRNGPTGIARLTFFDECARFFNVIDDEYDASE